jgi:protein-S-isoprenylcysteine O-methyltransferase Ste14
MKSTKIMPPTWMLIAIIAMLVLNFLLPVAKVIPMLWNLSGLVFLALGITLNLIADRAFQRAGTTIKPYQESSNLVTSGVFQVSRNPMYLGMVLILIGVAVLLRSLSPLLVVIPFAVLIDQIYIRVEEQMLTEKFGAKWQAYKAQTRRWL